MGAGIAAVAGIENEPSSCCTAIEEAQAKLRQELAGRNERRRELEFLEKGGDPLEFKFIESSGLWSLPADPYSSHPPHSDKKENLSFANLKSDKLESAPIEDGSEPKRARGTTGKFCYVEREVIPPESLPTSISTSAEQDGRDAPKREIDVVKSSNKSAIKGQYARRNRQRSNRFGNGYSLLLDSSKPETEGASNYSSTVRESIFNENKPKDVKEDHIQEQTVSQTQVTDNAEGPCVAPIKSVPADDLPSNVSSCLLKGDIFGTEDHEKHPVQAPLAQDDLDSKQNVNEMVATVQQQLSNPSDAGEQTKSLEVDQSAGPVTVKESEQILDQSVKMDVVEESSTKPSDEIVPLSNEPAKDNVDLDTQAENMCETAALAVAVSTDPIVTTTSVSEASGKVENDSIPVPLRESDSVVEPMSASEVIDEKVDAPDICAAQNNNVDNKSTEQVEEVKVKVEDGMPDSACSLSGAGLSTNEVPTTAQANSTLQQDDREISGDAVSEGIQAKVSIDNKLPSERPEEKKAGDNLSDVKTDISISSKKSQKDVNAHQSESIKDSLRQSGDGVKRRSFQEPPRRKCHWDFVLEEMAWLANDFMQERLWKIAAAAQVARWVVKEKWQCQFEEAELCKRQQKIAKIIAKSVTKFWLENEGNLLKDTSNTGNVPMEVPMEDVVDVKIGQSSKKEAYESQSDSTTKSTMETKTLPIQAYAVRFIKDSLGKQALSQAQAPLTPDRVSESGLFEFWEEQFPEESLFYTVPENAMEIYCQSIVSQWEKEYEQRLHQHDATTADSEPHPGTEATEYSTGPYSVPPLTSPLVTGKRSSGFYGSHPNIGGIPTKRMRTSAVAARQRAAGVPGHVLSGSAAHYARSDISSCETNSQQDEITTLVDGSTVSGRTGDADSNGMFMRNNSGVDGVDSPLKNKKKKKIRPFSGGHGLSAALDVRESEQLWHRQSEQKEHIKHKGEQLSQIGSGSPVTDGLGANSIMPHGSVNSSANKLIKQINNRDRGRKYKAGKASLNQAGIGIPWSPIEDQAILGLVYELGANWELVSDILSSNSQLKGIYRKPKDCKERYRMLTERLGGDGGDSPDDPSSSAHLLSLTQKGGTRFLPQHLEETLKSHIDCILQLHQQLRLRKLQMESQELKQLVPEHESHSSKNAGFPPVPLTPLELCDQAAEPVSHGYPLPSAHGMGIQNLMSSTVGLRPSSVMSVLQGASNLHLNPSMPQSAVARDVHRMGATMRPLTAEEQRLRYNRMGAGRGLQGSSAGMMGGLSRGVPLSRSALSGMTPIGASNISAGMNTVLPSVGLGLSGAGAASSPMNMMRRPRETIPMGQSPTAVNSPNSNLVSSSTAQPQQLQLLQHSNLQQNSPSSTQQQTYNMMRVSKERQQLQSDSQKRLLQQQPSPTSSSSQPPFPSTQSFPTSQQHVMPSHAHMFSQSAQVLMQPHNLQQESGLQQHAVPPVLPQSFPQTSVSPSGPQNSQNPQQHQLLSQGHQHTSAQLSLQTKQQHQPSSTKQVQQQQGKNKGLSRGSPMQGQPSSLPSQLPAGQQMSSPSTGQPPQSSPATSFPPAPEAAGQQYQQKSFSLSGKQIPLSQTTSISNSPPIQPTSSPPSSLPSTQQQSPVTITTLPSSQQQQRRANQQTQAQQRRPQSGQAGSNVGTPVKNGMQARTVPSQLSGGFPIGGNANSPLGMSPPAAAIPLSSPSTSGGGTVSSPQWKPGQNFSPMAAGLYNLSRNNNGGAAQPPHLPLPMAIHPQASNGSVPVSSTSLASQESGRVPQQSTKPSSGTSSVRTMATSQSPHTAPAQRQQLAQQQVGCVTTSQASSQTRPAASGTTPGSE